MNIPQRARFWIYVATGLGSILIAYLQAKHYIGPAEVTAWMALAAFVNGLSAWNARQ